MTQSNHDLIEEMRWQLGKIRDKQAENETLLGKLDAAKDQLEALEVKVSSTEGAVTVTAGSGGIVRSITLTDSAMAMNARTLTSTINDTMRTAIARATERQLEIVRGHVGDTLEPTAILGPQAKLAAFGMPAEPAAAHDPQDYDDEPVSSIFDSRER